MKCVRANVHGAVVQMLLEIVTGKHVKSNLIFFFIVSNLIVSYKPDTWLLSSLLHNILLFWGIVS